MCLRLRSLYLGASLLFLLACPALQAAEPKAKAPAAVAKSDDDAAGFKNIDELAAKGQDSVDPLTKLLADPSPKVRARAAHALGRIGAGAKPAIESLVGLLKDDDAGVRLQAVRAIVAIHPGPKVMIPLFIKIMEDSDAAIRVRVLDAVSDAGPAAVPGLILALDNEKAAYWACLVLRQMGPGAKDAVPALAKKLASKELEVRREAALALGAIGEAAKSAAPQLAAALNDKDMSPAATFALGQIGQIPAAAEKTIRANAASQDKFLSTVSYWALARVHPTDKELRRQATERLVERIMDKDPYVRAAAARGLAALPPAPEITLPVWEKALKNADETTAHYALDALAGLGPAALPRLMEALKHKQLRAQVLYVLGQLGPKAAPATAALSKLVTDADAHVAAEAALTLGKIGPAAASSVPALLAALDQEDCPNAHAIVFALGQIGPAAGPAVPMLTKLLQGPDQSLAATSAWALVQIQPKSPEIVAKAVAAIVASLADPLPETRVASIEALGSLGPSAKGAIPALEKATKDGDESVRAAAAAAIARIRTPAAK